MNYRYGRSGVIDETNADAIIALGLKKIEPAWGIGAKRRYPCKLSK